MQHDDMKKKTCKISRWQLLKAQLQNLDPDAFAKMAAETPHVEILDVRTPGEFAQGTLFNARNMDYLGPDFWTQFEQLDASRSILVFCRTGRRSVRVCTLLKNAGFQKVFNLDGGLLAWQAAGREIPK